MSTGYFKLKNTSDGQFMFNLRVRPGDQVIATSERYTTKQNALKGIESVKKHAADAPVEDKTESGKK